MSQDVRFLEFLQDNTKGKPNEDSVLFSRTAKSFAVADGVTRFVPAGKEYPADPTLSKKASLIFCSQATSELVSPLIDRKVSEEIIWEAFRDSNEIIRLINKGFGIDFDYLENDYGCCVAVLGALVGNTFYYGYIGDCGLLVFDKSLNPIFLSDNSDFGPLELFRDGMSFANKEEKVKFMREVLRNRPESRIMTYGALTGEKEALAYVRTGSISLEPGDTVLLFSDGIYPFIFEEQFREVLRKQLCSEFESTKLMEYAIKLLTGKLSAQHVSNLDDDKAFVAFSIIDS